MSKKCKYIAVTVIGLFIVSIIYIFAYTLEKKEEARQSVTIKAETITGLGNDSNNHTYTILTQTGAHKEIPCTESQYYTVFSKIGDLSNIPIVIYEENSYGKKPKKILEILMYEYELYNDKDIRSLKDKVSYKLIDEKFVSIGDNHGLFTRIYVRHLPNSNDRRLEAHLVLTPNFDNANLAKNWIKENESEQLNLKPLTIVDDKVLNKWKQEGYEPSSEYTIESPEELSFEELVNLYGGSEEVP